MIEVKDLSLTYRSDRESHLAVDRVSFRVEAGEFYTLLGPSGCGKTTILRCVAGLERPDSGEIVIDDQTVSSVESGVWVPPNARAIGMVFQSYAIWPHMTVFENVAFPLRYGVSRTSSADIRSRVRDSLAMVQLDGLEDRPAPHLSGGQQQRLALARALVMEPKVLLLDEPLSNLDAKLREEMRVELRHLVKSFGVTTIFVTHEQIEALTLSDEIAVMNEGRIVQEGGPLDIYSRPADPFVANFIGQSNMISGTVGSAPESGGAGTVDSAIGTLACTLRTGDTPGSSVMIAIRPENVLLAETGDESGNIVEGVVASRIFLGSSVECIVAVGATDLRLLAHPDAAPEQGETVRLRLPARHCLVMRS